MEKSISILFLIAFIELTSCTKVKIEGKVVDAFGKPVQGATVSVEGTQFTDQTDGSGNYSVSYVPGSIKVLISKPNYTDTFFTANIATKSTYPAQPATIYEIPKEAGIYLMQGGSYKSLTRLPVLNRASPIEYQGLAYSYEVYYLDYYRSNVIMIQHSDSTLTFIDCDHRPMALFALSTNENENEIFHQMVIADNNLSVSNNASIVKETYRYFKNHEAVLRFVNLAPGNYAFVQYNSGNPLSAIGNVYTFMVVQ